MRYQNFMENNTTTDNAHTQMCPHFRRCGGCSWLDIAYEEQLEKKREILERHLAPFTGCEREELIPALDQFHYRNKMEFTFGGSAEEPLIGQHYKGSFHRIENLTRCLLFDERIGEVLETVREYAKSAALEPYNPKTHAGFLRHLKARCSKTSGEMMLILVTAGDFAGADEFAKIFEKFPFIKSVYYGINSRLSDIADCEKLFLLGGKEYLTENIDGTSFIISPESFFQPNTMMSAMMYGKARDMMGLTGEEYVLDLYSGSGGMGLYIAKKSKYLYSIELQKESVDIMKKNLAANGIENAEPICGDVKTALALIRRRSFDYAILDPPRSGMSKKAVRRVALKDINKILFFSCKIETAVQNLVEFGKYGYKVTRAIPFDMFPNTPFVETVFLLSR
ncbi:MAG: 23S rRNA (uracil(1939)-C(5))-methyltransferase RlmD [Elusimicrobia bacterium CG_4_10_14_3_um_filter_49_12_50_7]|nr:MAG: 23S rRNA (uracil(1939)-C(5))-methyltransferase RlmD [Elusimicrobia bacterium CG_4_10_14_3_um_filter_49_12_50_7]